MDRGRRPVVQRSCVPEDDPGPRKAKPEAVDFYARYGFVPLRGVREGELLGGACPLFLPLDTLAAAAEAPATSTPGPAEGRGEEG